LNWRRQGIYALLLLILLSPLAAPQLLAFPFSARVGAHDIYAEAPIGPRISEIVGRADDVARGSPIAGSAGDQPIFLTDGGWRWTWLSLGSLGAFAITRPLVEAIVVNRSDQSADIVRNGRAVGGRRSLSGTIAHEMTHVSIRTHFGVTADWRFPAWLREGYCDYVAGGGSLSDKEAAKLEQTGTKHPALIYWRGRKQVEAELRRNGGSVDKLFAAHRI